MRIGNIYSCFGRRDFFIVFFFLKSIVSIVRWWGFREYLFGSVFFCHFREIRIIFFFFFKFKGEFNWSKTKERIYSPSLNIFYKSTQKSIPNKGNKGQGILFYT